MCKRPAQITELVHISVGSDKKEIILCGSSEETFCKVNHWSKLLGEKGYRRSEAGNIADIPPLCSMAHVPHGLDLDPQKHLAKQETRFCFHSMSH